MKLGISQLAFKKLSLKEIIRKLKPYPMQGLELAATLLWPNPIKASSTERKEVRRLISDAKIEVIGLQSLLFGQPDLIMFDSPLKRQACLGYLGQMIELCHDIGGKNISFGCARNRHRGNMSIEDALAIAQPFFKKLADVGERFDVVVSLEPLAREYGCDFVVMSQEGSDLVKRINHPYFRLLLDTGNLTMSGESINDAITRNIQILNHVQVSDPHMSPPGSAGVAHNEISKTLRAVGYNHWVTIECFLKDQEQLGELDYAFNCYGPRAAAGKF